MADQALGARARADFGKFLLSGASAIAICAFVAAAPASAQSTAAIARFGGTTSCIRRCRSARATR